MIPVFVYKTLEDIRIQQKVLGHKAEVRAKAFLSGYTEIEGTWPTVKRELGRRVPGEIIIVSGNDLKKLDAWENRYKRKMVATTAGQAWVYVYVGPHTIGEQDAD